MATAKRASVRRKPVSSALRPKAKPKTRRKGGPAPGTPSPLRTKLSVELEAHARRLFEETDQPTTHIALDCGVDESVIRRMARWKGWVRYVPPPRALPSAARLLADVAALEALPPVTPEERIAAIDRLYRETMSQLAEVEALRARTTPAPKDAERNAHTLSSLTETMRKLQGVRAQLQGSPHDDHAYDTPADLDAFRDELARRIRAFVASRTGARDDRGAAAGSAEAAR